MKPVVMILIVLLVVFWLAGKPSTSGWNPDSVQAAGGALQAATPTPPAAAPARTSPLVGFLVLLAPAVLLAWQKSRPNADKKRTACGCLPIIDEDKPSGW